jgi:hypothetical protein
MVDVDHTVVPISMRRQPSPRVNVTDVRDAGDTGQSDDSAAAARFASVCSIVDLLWAARSETPVAFAAIGLKNPSLRSVQLSVTVHPLCVGVMSYAHRATGRPNAVTRNENRRPGSASTTFATVFHDLPPCRFEPRNAAPGAGPVAPLIQAPPSFSGDHSAMRGRSDTISHTASAEAATTRLTDTSGLMTRRYTSAPWTIRSGRTYATCRRVGDAITECAAWAVMWRDVLRPERDCVRRYRVP